MVEGVKTVSEPGKLYFYDVFQAHLSEHQTRHSAVRSYLCEVCGASFKTKSVQRHHVTTIHSNPRSFHCDQCEKRFNTRYALRRHQSIHDTATVRLLEQMVVQQQQQQTVEVVMDQQVIAELWSKTKKYLSVVKC